MVSSMLRSNIREWICRRCHARHTNNKTREPLATVANSMATSFLIFSGSSVFGPFYWIPLASPSCPPATFHQKTITNVLRGMAQDRTDPRSMEEQSQSLLKQNTEEFNLLKRNLVVHHLFKIRMAILCWFVRMLDLCTETFCPTSLITVHNKSLRLLWNLATVLRQSLSEMRQ